MRASLVVIMMQALYASWLGQNTLESKSKQQQKPASTWGSSKNRVESEGGKGRRLKPKGEVSIKRKLGFSSARILV
jgi:hypothetical protein